jgi:hypothetical protein
VTTRSYRNFVRPAFGPMPADDIGEVEWQMWIDELSREGLTRSRISTHVAVASAIYAWALVPSRRYATSNPLRLVELPPNDEKPRLRVASALEAAQLLEALALLWRTPRRPTSATRRLSHGTWSVRRRP